MKSKTVQVFLPCRKGSQRVPKKNIRPFLNYQHGLIEIKLKQLIDAKCIETIHLSSNDTDILDFADSIGSSKITLHHRSDDLASSTTKTDDLIPHVLELIQYGDILWTHVTSPFVNSSMYDTIIQQYFREMQAGYDSLMTTTLIRGFLWNKRGPYNYDRKLEKWPRTQTLEPLHEVNSAIFLANVQVFKKYCDRIGKRPYLYPLSKVDGFDIDWEDDFKIAESMLHSQVVDL